MAARSTRRFLRRFARPGTPVSREVLLRGRHVTAYLPQRPPPGGRVPAWVLLHGVTVPGRHHAALRRMAGALSAAGHLALVPEAPSWSALRVTPTDTEAAVHDALAGLPRWPEADAERVGLMGFSVAGTWALEAAAGPLGGRLRAVASMGGYADLHRVLLWLISGISAQSPPGPPDPYGAWVMGAAMLPHLEGHAWGSHTDRLQVSDALRRLALAAGQHGASASEAVYAPLMGDLRVGLSPGARQTWDLVALPEGRHAPASIPARLLASALAAAGDRQEPMLDPRGRLHGLAVPAFVFHGAGDRLIPAAEAPGLWQEVPPPARRAFLVTHLLGHTKRSEAGRLGPVGAVAEAIAFARFVHALLGAVEDG